MGIQCDACGDLLTAENFLKETNYDLVITDVMLGATIGLVLAKVIRDLKRTSKLVVVTGLSNSEFKEQFGDFECAAILHKPVNPVQLKNVARTCMIQAKVAPMASELDAADLKSRYNPERAFALLKYNESSIKEVMHNFGMYLSDSLSVITTVHDITRLKLMRKPFHDLGNLCYYFGAEVLFEMIGKYSVSQNEQVKLEMLPQIEAELKVVNELHLNKIQ
jgi:DNA-binding response OmpR family regulator